MPQPVYILFGAAWTWITALALGKLLLRRLGVRLYREEETPLAYLVGSACLSTIVFALAAAQIFYKGTVLATGAVALIAAWRLGVWKPREERLPPLPRWLQWGAGAVAAPFFLLCFATAMAPEMSPDGSSYHLGFVARYYREHGLRFIPTNMYAHLSQGIEMLFLYAYAFGRHSSAALEHFSFLVALSWMMVNYARRHGYPQAGVAAALMVFVSPVVGNDAASAYNDVAVAAILFAVFYLVQVWDTTRANALLVPIGLMAGFAYGSKYTAFVAIPYAVGWILWRLRKTPLWALRAALVLGLCISAMTLPWMVKNAIWVGNPFSPFLNRLFPNPYVRISFEEDYRRNMRKYEGIGSYWEIPLEVTVRGQILGGLFGPMFLLAPLAIGALRHSQGRRLLAAALLFGIPYVTNIGTRFLIPPLPYIAMALALTLAQWPRVLALLVVAHALSAWPDVLKLYSREYAWRLDRIWWKQALRIESEEGFLKRKWPWYSAARLVEDLTPPGSKVLTSSVISEAYTTREILTGFQSGEGMTLNSILLTPILPDSQPVRRLSFRFDPQRLSGVRVRQTANAASDHWSIAEMRVYKERRELHREPRWRLRAHPNPWDVREAFDNSPVTRWNSWETAWPGMFVAVDFGAEETVDEVVLEMSRDQSSVRVELDVRDDGHEWRVLKATPMEREVPPPLGMRREATEIVKDRGIGYVLVQDSDFWARDMAQGPRSWGVVLLGERYGFRLYKIE